MRYFFLFLIGVFSFSTANANETAGNCRKIKWVPGKIYEIKAKMYQGTHITLPENIMQVPICTNELWETDGGQNHIFVQPTSMQPQGKEAAMTIIGESNKSYHFTLKRVDDPETDADICVNIEKKKSSRFNEKAFTNRPKKIDTALLSQKINQLRSALEEQGQAVDEKIEDALTKYRFYMYTRYDWNDGNLFNKRKLISSVHDDGRFTYIRTFPNNSGLPALYAEIDGKKEMVEYKVVNDDLYRVAGIYQKFFLQYGKKKIKIVRHDGLNNGVY